VKTNRVRIVIIQPSTGLMLNFAWFDSCARYLFTTTISLN
jgi:hypothetical protein